MLEVAMGECGGAECQGLLLLLSQVPCWHCSLDFVPELAPGPVRAGILTLCNGDRTGWDGERPCHCSGLWGLSPSHRVRLECTSLQRSWCLPAASLRQSSRWPDLSRERRCGWSRGEQPVVCALSTARAGGRLGGLPGTALTDQLQGQDAVRHCPLDVVVASGRVIIPCEKVGLEEGSVWGSSGGSWSTYGTRKNHGFLNFSSCLS